MAAVGIRYDPSRTDSDDIAKGVFLGIGIIMCFAGYRLYKIALCAVAFVFVGSIGYEVALKAGASEKVSFIIFLVVGVVAAFLAYPLYKLVVFLLGALGGYTLGRLAYSSFAYQWGGDTVLIILVIVLAVICGALALFLMKPAIMILTAFFGAFYAMSGIVHFAEEENFTISLSVDDGIAIIHGDRNIPVYYYYSFAAMFFVGLCVQIFVTAREYVHSASRKDNCNYKKDWHGIYDV